MLQEPYDFCPRACAEKLGGCRCQPLSCKSSPIIPHKSWRRLTAHTCGRVCACTHAEQVKQHLSRAAFAVTDHSHYYCCCTKRPHMYTRSSPLPPSLPLSLPPSLSPSLSGELPLLTPQARNNMPAAPLALPASRCRMQLQDHNLQACADLSSPPPPLCCTPPNKN